MDVFPRGSWVPLDSQTPATQTPQPSYASTPQVPDTQPAGGGGGGPLQAFGQVHRALRESEKRLSSVSNNVHETDQKLESTTRRLQQDGRRLRAETSQMLSDLEELVLQIYQEHEAGLKEAREMNLKLRAEMESEQSAHRAALVAQQGQIDALAAALRKQTELLDEHVGSSGVQMAAVQAEAGELHRAFKAQGAAVQATKAFISSVDEKLAARKHPHYSPYTTHAHVFTLDARCQSPPPLTPIHRLEATLSAASE